MDKAVPSVLAPPLWADMETDFLARVFRRLGLKDLASGHCGPARVSRQAPHRR